MLLCVNRQLCFNLILTIREFYLTVLVLNIFCFFLFAQTFVGLELYTEILLQVHTTVKITDVTMLMIHHLILLACTVTTNTYYLKTVGKRHPNSAENPRSFCSVTLNKNISSLQPYKYYHDDTSRASKPHPSHQQLGFFLLNIISSNFVPMCDQKT